MYLPMISKEGRASNQEVLLVLGILKQEKWQRHWDGPNLSFGMIGTATAIYIAAGKHCRQIHSSPSVLTSVKLISMKNSIFL